MERWHVPMWCLVSGDGHSDMLSVTESDAEEEKDVCVMIIVAKCFPETTRVAILSSKNLGGCSDVGRAVSRWR
jgi:hypothetical protein